MIAYPHNDKEMYLARVRAHRAADELVRGIGWETDGRTRGCAIGCTLNTYDHSLYPSLLGVPEQLAYLEDWLFEQMIAGHQEWPERFLDAIEPGSDLLGVWPAWVVRLLDRRLQALGEGDEDWRQQVFLSIVRIRDLHKASSQKKFLCSADESAEVAFRAANAQCATNAAAYVARTACGSAMAAANAANAANAAAWAIESAEWAAEAAAVAAEINAQAEDLIELIKAAR